MSQIGRLEVGMSVPLFISLYPSLLSPCGSYFLGLLFVAVDRNIIKQFIAKPHSPAWIPHGLEEIGNPVQFPNIIKRVNAVPIKRPLIIDCEDTDFTCTPK